MSMENLLKEMRELEERFLIDDPAPQTQDLTQPSQDLTQVQKQDVKQTGNLLTKVIGKSIEQLQDLIEMMSSSNEDLDGLFGERAKERIGEMGLKLKEISDFFKPSNSLETTLENPLKSSGEVPPEQGDKVPVEDPEEVPDEEEIEMSDDDEELEEPEETEEPEDSEEESDDDEEEGDEDDEDDDEDVEESILGKSSKPLTEGFFEVVSDGKSVGQPTSFNAAKELADKSAGKVEIRVYDDAKAHGGKLKKVLVKQKDQWVGKQ